MRPAIVRPRPIPHSVALRGRNSVAEGPPLISIHALKSAKQTDFEETKLSSFGVRVGPRTKTLIVKRDNLRIAIGAGPDKSLQSTGPTTIAYARIVTARALAN